MTMLRTSFTLLSGGVSGGLAAAIVTWLLLRDNEMRHLLSGMLAIQALKEGWILEGRGSEKKRLSEQKDLPTEKPSNDGPWLRKVEVRAVLDCFQWNAAEVQFYEFLDGRRTWIVRDRPVSKSAYPRPLAEKGGIGHPALISSRVFEELATWIERVTTARSWASLWILSSRGLDMVQPLLGALCTKDRIL